MTKPFGEQMKEARKEKGLTQEDLAKQMSVSRSTVSHWEIGRKKPEKEFLDRLTQLLEVEFTFDQENEEKELLEKPIESREVPSAEEYSNVIRKSPEKQITLKACIAAVCAAILLTSLVSWFVWQNWAQKDPEGINFVITGSDVSGKPLEYQGHIELEYQVTK